MNNGEIFEHVPLSNCVASIRTGQTFKTSLQHNANGDLNVLQPKDISNGRIESNPVCINKSEVSALENHILKIGDVLMVNKGTKLGSFLYEGEPAQTVATSSFFVITPNPDVLLSRYLFWYLNQPPAKEYFSKSSFGSTIPSITKVVLSKLPIPVIPINEQKYIIEFIKESEQELQLLKELIEKKQLFSTSYVWEQIIKK